MSAYSDFIAAKHPVAVSGGFEARDLHPSLFAYQRESVAWATRQGRNALFLDTGLGKTFCQLAWADQCVKHTGKPALILTPLAVGAQTLREAHRFGFEAKAIRDDSEVGPGLNIVNYHRMDGLDIERFGAVVLDESSILKSFDGKTCARLIAGFAGTRFRQACTATPAPNDYMELGNHSQFLGVMSNVEMLSRFFVHDSGETGVWKMKQHGAEAFWSWVSSWAICAMSPADLGHPEETAPLPPLTLVEESFAASHCVEATGLLFPDLAVSATDLGRIKRATLDERVGVVRRIVMEQDRHEPVLVWVQTNDESAAIGKAIEGAVEIVGSESPEAKEEKLLAFSSGAIRVLVTKASIAGFGLNWQHCNRMVFASVNYSYEQVYQAIRRCWRFGQTRPVTAHLVASEGETRVLDAIRAKGAAHEEMKSRMKLANFKSRDALLARVREKYEATELLQSPRFLG